MSTVLKAARQRTADLAAQLDAHIEDEEKANRIPAPIPPAVRAELQILDEINALNEALRQVGA